MHIYVCMILKVLCFLGKLNYTKNPLIYSNINSFFKSLDILQAVVPKPCVQPGCTSLTQPSHNVWHVNQETTAQERVSVTPFSGEKRIVLMQIPIVVM